jgi:hypothetical protein
MDATIAKRAKTESEDKAAAKKYGVKAPSQGKRK